MISNLWLAAANCRLLFLCQFLNNSIFYKQNWRYCIYIDGYFIINQNYLFDNY